MTVEQIEERLKKAEDKKSKKLITLEKKKNSIIKKKDQLTKLGVNVDEVLEINNSIYDYRNTGSNWQDIYWTYCDIIHLEEDVERIDKEIKETELLINKYTTQLENTKKVTFVYDNIPQVMKDCETDLVANWDEYDENHKKMLRDKYEEYCAMFPKNSTGGFKKFIKEFHYSAYEFMHEPVEDTHKNNSKVARDYILDLYNRVIAITGDITSVKDLRLTGPSLNGIVEGVNGRAEVRTILAGGYNIQRLHNRTIVIPC